MAELKVLETEQTDEDFAKNLRRMANENLDEVCKLLDFANSRGFTIGFSIGIGPSGKNVISQLTVARHF